MPGAWERAGKPGNVLVTATAIGVGLGAVSLTAGCGTAIIAVLLGRLLPTFCEVCLERCKRRTGVAWIRAEQDKAVAILQAEQEKAVAILKLVIDNRLDL